MSNLLQNLSLYGTIYKLDVRWNGRLRCLHREFPWSMSDKRATANTEPKRMDAIAGRSFKQVRFCFRRGKRNFAEAFRR